MPPDDSGFKAPALPRPRMPDAAHGHPTETPPSQAPPLRYTPPDNAERPARSYILEEIKDGMLVETHVIPRTKTFFVFGRLPMCDFPMDHQSISRYHCVLQFAASNHTTLVDLGSSHGTFVKKQQIRPNTPRTLDIGDQIRFGMSTRTWCLGTTDAEFLEQREESRHQEMQKAILERARQTEALGVARTAARQGGHPQMTLGDNNAELLHMSRGNPVAADWAASDRAWYRRNPIDSLQTVLDDNNQEYEPEVVDENSNGDDDEDDRMKQHRKPGLVTVRVALPFIDEHGKPLFGVGKATKHHEAERRACIDALEELDKRSYLEDPREQRRRAAKSKKKAVGDDDDDDEDEFYDRTLLNKRTRKSKASEVETFESLMEKHRIVCTDIEDAEQQLKEADEETIESTANDAMDELDAYMNSLTRKEQESTRKSLEQRLGEMKKEVERLEVLIRIAAPDYQPQIRSGLRPEGKPNPEPQARSDPKPPASSSMPPPALPAKRPATEVKEAATPKQPKVVAGPTLPPPMAAPRKRDEPAWQAPTGQTGDGKTALNDKLGY